MNNKVHIDSEIIKLLYFKYKEYLLPVMGLIISWLIFFQFVIPQIQVFLATKDEVAASEQQLAVLSQNYNTIASINETELDSLLATANRALPSVKDFAGILNAISTAASLSGVSVNDYSFTVGDINNIISSNPVTPTIQLSLSLKGNINQTKKFLNTLSTQLPLSEVITIDISSASSAGINVNFFYSVLPKLSFDDTSPLQQLTSDQKKMLTDFEKNTPIESTPNFVSTPAAQFSPAKSSSSSSQ